MIVCSSESEGLIITKQTLQSFLEEGINVGTGVWGVVFLEREIPQKCLVTS